MESLPPPPDQGLLSGQENTPAGTLIKWSQGVDSGVTAFIRVPSCRQETLMVRGWKSRETLMVSEASPPDQSLLSRQACAHGRDSDHRAAVCKEPDDLREPVRLKSFNKNKP